MFAGQSQFKIHVAAILNSITIKVISPISGYALADHQIQWNKSHHRIQGTDI